MPRYARIERDGLADELLTVDPDSPTLCGDWTARDLAAHLVIRERRPDAAPGIVVGALAGHTERVQRQVRDRYSYPELVALVRQQPWWTPFALPALDELSNTVEYFVHREDVRRARPDWQPRPLDAGLARALWRRVPGMAKLGLRKLPASVRIVAPGLGEATAGAGGPAVTVTGDAGELLLFFLGRQAASRVQVVGPEELTGRLRSMRLGL